MKIKEELLHFIWQYKLFHTHSLYSTDGEKIEILDFGRYNFDAGPDFSMAKIRINQTILVGNIEIHVYASDYIKHKHTNDSRYKNIILHVVYEEDKTLANIAFPTIELKHYLEEHTLAKYALLMDTLSTVPCQQLYQSIDPIRFRLFAQKLCIERLEKKVHEIAVLHKQCKGDWNKTAILSLSAYMGQNINKEAFMRLLMSFDLRIISKYCKNKIKTEALLMGQSAILHSAYVAKRKHPYIEQLKKEYQHLQTLNELEPIQAIEWKFAKMRPVAFPTVRISQLAHLLFLYPNFFDEIILAFDIKNIYKQLDVQCREVWSPNKQETITLGKSTIDIIIINAIVPLMFYYGQASGNEYYMDRSINILELIKAEQNKITRLYESIGFTIETALESQALLTLKNQYCETKNCLNCAIGLEILRK
ncbi:MAG: DUF2851 family protein [Bacteroidota bacterium]